MESKSTCIVQTASKMHVLRFVMKHVPSWNMLQIGNVQTSSYRSCMLKARSWSIKTCSRRSKLRPSYYICLSVCFSVMNVGLLQRQWAKKTSPLSALDMTKFAQRQSEACFKMALFSERHTMSIWNMFQDGNMFQKGAQHTHCYMFSIWPGKENFNKFKEKWGKLTVLIYATRLKHPSI